MDPTSAQTDSWLIQQHSVHRETSPCVPGILACAALGDHHIHILLSSQFWPIPSMSRRVINCTKQCLSHPFSRIKWIDQWAVEPDPVLTSTTSAKIGKTAISSAGASPSYSPQVRA